MFSAWECNLSIFLIFVFSAIFTVFEGHYYIDNIILFSLADRFKSGWFALVLAFGLAGRLDKTRLDWLGDQLDQAKPVKTSKLS